MARVKKEEKEKKLPVGFSRRSNGSLVYQFTVEGKRYYIYGQTVKECREKEIEKRKKIAEGIIGKDTTIEKWMIQWSESREKKLTGGSVRTNKKHMNRACSQMVKGMKFGDIKLSKLEAAHVRELQKVLEGKFKTRTVNDTISYLKKGIEAAVNERIINWNPCRAVESLSRTEPKASDTTHRCLTKEEVDLFMNKAIEEECRYVNLFTVLLQTGLRLGEATAFSPSDIHGDKLEVHKTVTREESGYIVREQTKTEAGRRTVPLTDKAKAAIKEEIREREKNSGPVRIDKPVFMTGFDGIIKGDYVNNDIKDICEKAGVDRFTAHAFRATFISRCVADGMPVKELMEICGHKDVQMTLGLYAHSNDDKKAEELKKIAL